MNGVVPSLPTARFARIGAVAALVVVAGCASSASPSGSASNSPAATTTPSPLVPTSTPFPAATLYTSPLYKYSLSFPAGWQVIPAQSTWDGKSAIGHNDSIVDQWIGPQVANRCKTVFVCGPIAWAVAAPTTKSPADLAAETDTAEARDHPCPVSPESQVGVKIDGEAALLASKHCPADGGLLVLRAIAVHKGIGYFFWMQDPSNERAVEPLDRSDFSALIAAIRLPD